MMVPRAAAAIPAAATLPVAALPISTVPVAIIVPVMPVPAAAIVVLRRDNAGREAEGRQQHRHDQAGFAPSAPRQIGLVVFHRVLHPAESPVPQRSGAALF